MMIAFHITVAGNFNAENESISDTNSLDIATGGIQNADAWRWCSRCGSDADHVRISVFSQKLILKRNE